MATLVRYTILPLMALAAALPASAAARPHRPAPPGGLHAAYITRSGASLTWQRLGGHRVKRVAVVVDGRRIALLPGRRHRLTLRHMACGRSYVVKIQPRTRPGQRVRPLRRVVKTATCRPPAPPSAVHATGATRRSVSLAWERLRGHRVKHVVVFVDGQRIARLRRQRDAFKLTGLICGQRYHVGLQAGTRRDRSRRAHLVVKTLPCRANAAPSPPAPASLRVTRVTRTSMLVAWKRLRSPEVTRLALFLNHRRVAVVPRLHNRFRISGLRCAQRYRVSIESHGRRGHASRRTNLVVRTLSCRAGEQRGAGVSPHIAPGAGPTPGGGAGAAARHRVFAYYYLWWSAGHWRDVLGPNYPYSANPLPLPAHLDSSGCNASPAYSGATVTDVPARLYSQDDPGFIEADVREAAAAGLAGFAVNWAGDGTSTQTPGSNPYSSRMQAMVDAVHRVNAEGIPFKLWLSYKASAAIRSITAIDNDLAYFVRMYGNDPAFDRSQSNRPTVIWNGSRKYPLSELQAVSTAYRSRLRIIGDETTWSTSRAPYLDGNAYYWSSQDPYANPASFGQLKALAAAVRASGRNPDGSPKAWISPLAPGYNSTLAKGSTCVPRFGGATLRRIFEGNRATNPDAWAFISWNEIVEGTYIDPMTRWGRQDLDVLRSLIFNG
jgi:hypothetical protein